MTVTSQTSKVTTTGDSSATTFSFSPIVIYSSSDLSVVTTVLATGVETTRTEGTGTTNWSLSLTAFPATGSITYPASGSAIDSTQSITIKRVLTLEQQTDLNNQGGYFPDTQEDQLDKLVMIDLQQQEIIDRSLSFPVSYTGGASTEIPAPAANAYLVWNDAGTALENTTGASGTRTWPDGTEGLPGLAAQSDLDSGFYRIGANNIGLSLGGTKEVDFAASTATFTGTVEPSGDTSAGDNAAIGYTATEGLILTGQGSTNDVTIKNDADAEVMGVLTGTTTADFKGDVTALNFQPDGDTSSGDSAAIGYTATEGIIVTGQGSTNDVTIKNDADQVALEVPTGTQNVNCLGDLTVTGTVTFNGDVNQDNATNITTSDYLIEINSGAASNANDMGIIMERGSTGDNAAFIWDESGDYFQVGTTTATGASSGNLTVTDAQLHAAGLTLSGTSSNLGTVTTVDINGGTVDGAVIGGASAAAGTFTSVTCNTDLTLATGATVTGIADEDDMSSDSATLLATQQSIKAYVDSNLTAAGIQMTWESTTTDVDQGNGKVWANNATLSSATVLYFDDVENNGTSINSFIDSLDDPTFTDSAIIYIAEGGTGGAGVVFKVSGAVTSASTYSKVAVTHVATYGTLTDGDLIGVTIAFSGNNGAINNIVEDTTPQLGGDLDANGNMIKWAKGADVASASALPILTDGNYFDVTGTTTITSINTAGGDGTIAPHIKLHFDGALTLTHHATNLILPGAANITTAAGDEYEFVEYGSGTWRCTGWSLAGTAPGGGGGGGYLGENGAIGDSGDIIRVNQQTLDTNNTISATDNASAAGPLAIASGVTLTVSSGATFVVI